MNPTELKPQTKPLLGISRCLLGDEVRFDGGHKRSKYIIDTLGQHFDYVRVCPEVEAGLPVPRPSIRQVRTDDGLRVLSSKGDDVTGALCGACDSRTAQLKQQAIRGFIVKKDSPTCGFDRVRVYRGQTPERSGRGVFVSALAAKIPNLPIEDEGRLNDARLRENFITRVFTYDRFRTLVESSPAPRDLMAFHGEHKYLLLAHAPALTRHLGRLVAASSKKDINTVLSRYEDEMMGALAKPAKIGGHVNALQHIGGFLKGYLNSNTRSHLAETIEAYRRGEIPLIAPITLLNHHLTSVGHRWVRQQRYLNPYPASLSLRNRI